MGNVDDLHADSNSSQITASAHSGVHMVAISDANENVVVLHRGEWIC